MGKFLKKHMGKIIISAVAILVVGYIIVGQNAKKNQLPIVVTTTVEHGELVNSVSVNGTVESENSNKVYAKLTYPVKVNNVVVGDKVNKGDVLCELDTDNLESTIAQQRAAAGSASAMSNNSIALAEKQYEQAKSDLESDSDSVVFQAEQAVIAAKQQLESSEVSLNGAIDSLQKSREDDRFSGVDDKSSMTINAINSRDHAYANYEAAKQNVVNAEESLELAKHANQQKIDSLEDSIQTQRVAAGQTSSQWVAISSLEDDLTDAAVLSPVTGVVTGVYVDEGATSTGLMYIIEDVSSLKVSAKLKEYDLNSVTEGNMVEIKSDATGEELYLGRVETIAPTTIKSLTGDNVEGSGGGEFITKIDVDSKGTKLRIGTRARMEIVYEKKENVNFVAFESLIVDETGKQFVLVPEHEDGNTYVLVAIPVETGMETDFMVEIISDKIKPGDIVLSSTKDLKAGMKVQLQSDIDAALAGKNDTTPVDPEDDKGSEEEASASSQASVSEEASKPESQVTETTTKE